jgi:HEAT repeat protein
MGDPEAVDVLIQTLQSSQTLGVSSAVAKALGLIGDSSAIDPLKQIATDKSMGDITRAFACVALGMVCEKTSLPWNARISADNNYRARVPAIDEVLDIL